GPLGPQSPPAPERDRPRERPGAVPLGPHAGAGPVRTAGFDGAGALGHPFDFRYRRHRLQYDRERRPGENAAGLAVRLRRCLRFEGGPRAKTGPGAGRAGLMPASWRVSRCRGSSKGGLMAKSDPARRRFMAALALYLVWVGALTAMAVTTGKKPPAHIV